MVFCRALATLAGRSVDAPLALLEEGLQAVQRQLAPTALTALLHTTQRSLGPARQDAAAPCPSCHRVVADGAHWIWELAAVHFSERTEVVDWYHAAQHVWDVAKAVQPESAVLAWANARLAELWNHDIATMLQAFKEVKPATPEAAAVLARETQYFRTHRGRMAYPELRRAEQPIGSGAVESAAKHLIQQRLKRAGARWSDEGAPAIIALRCVRATLTKAA